MSNKAKGLYNKFNVERVDGKSDIGEKHFGCRYFVLDADHDPYAKAALLAYADACQEEFSLLAFDVRALADGYGFPFHKR